MRSLRGVTLAVATLLCTPGFLAPVRAADFGDGLVHLRAETYGVARGPSAAIPAERETALAPSDVATWVVVVSGPADDDVRARIEGSGGRVVGAVPSNAYLVRADRAVSRKIAALPFTARVDLLRPSWKISPDLGAHAVQDPDRAALGSARVLEVTLYPDEDRAAAALALTAAGARVVQEPAPGGAPRFLVVAEPGVVPRIAAVSAVEWIEEPGELAFRNDITRWVIQSNQTDVLPLYDHGLRGEGEIIGHIDGQILLTSCFFEDTVDNTPGPNHRKVVANRTNGDISGGAHGCHTAGTAAGDREPTRGSTATDGMAPHARLSFTNLGLVTGLFNAPSNLIQYLDLAHQDGARVHTNSWGEDPITGLSTYTSMSVDVDTFSRQNEDDLVVFAVANQSPTGTVMAPENSKNCLGVAASRQAPRQDEHGSGVPGPTFDGRRKPEVNAPGTGILSAAFAGCATATLSGTSMAAPAVAGGAALIRQYFRRGFYPTGKADRRNALIPTGALLKAMTINSTVDMTAVPGYPSDLEGWGRILLDDALFFQGDTRRLLIHDVRQANGLSTGQSATLPFRVTDSFEPLKITMAFTDQPAAQLAAYTPVNDLDLEVRDPSGTVYLGNVFDAGVGVSVPGGSADVLNNVERVIVDSPPTGQWTLTVRASSVPLGPQGYAVVVNGGLLPLALEQRSEVDIEVPGNGGGDELPGEFSLRPISTSPFQTSFTVRLTVPQSATVEVDVYDIAGRRVRTLLDRTMRPGEYPLVWDGRDANGQLAAPGVYFIHLRGPGVARTVRGVLLR